jgi:hypothetical protein
MKVKELIKRLSKFPQDAEVILSKDEEGNSFSPLAKAQGKKMIYIRSSSYAGIVRLSNLTKALVRQGYEEEDVYHGDPSEAVPCIVLWPTF